MAPLLRARGYEVFTAMTGRAALEAVERDKPDLIVLDLGCRTSTASRSAAQIRETPQRADRRAVGARRRKRQGAARSTPAPTTTSPSRSAPRNCSRASAPRCGASTRRRRRASRSCAATWSSTASGFACCADGEEVRLTPKEFELLTYLAQHPGRVLTHRAILKAIWGPHAVDQPEHLRVLVGVAAQEDRTQSVGAAVHPHRAVGRLSIRGFVIVSEPARPGRDAIPLTDTMTELPIACSLGGAELAARQVLLRSSVLADAVTTERLAEEYRWRFQDVGDVFARLGAVIDAERHCCRFLRFALVANPGLGSVTVEVTGPPGTADFLESWIAPRSL